MGTFGSGFTGNTPFVGPSTTPTADNYGTLVSFAGTPNISDTDKMQIKRFGNRMLSGFLETVSAMEPLRSDQVQWTEEGRLHLRYTATWGGEGAVTANVTTAQQFTITGPGTAADHAIRVGNTIIVSSDGQEYKGLVTGIDSSDASILTVQSYSAPATTSTASASYDAGFDGLATSAGGVTITVYGTEFAKGTSGIRGSIDRDYIDRQNNPTIKKGGYDINGSDLTQIGWIETFSESGESNGMFWWHTSELDERERFMDYRESSCLESVPAEAGSTLNGTETDGNEGLFYVLENRGNVFTGGFDDSNASNGRADFDRIIKQLTRQGAIQENMLYLDLDSILAIDNILAQQNGDVATDTNGTVSGTNFGMFQNSDQYLDLGFNSWKRGGFMFHYSNWKYLNDEVGRSPHKSTISGDSLNNIQGVMIPGGSSNVYDQMLGKTMKRPYLHIRYRQAGNENRLLKNWITGSAGGARTSDEDILRINYLTEDVLITQAPNNFILLKAE